VLLVSAAAHLGCQTATSILLTIEAPGLQLTSLEAEVAVPALSIDRTLPIPSQGGPPTLPASVRVLLPDADATATVTVRGGDEGGRTYQALVGPIAVIARRQVAPPAIVLGPSTVDGGIPGDLANTLLFADEFDTDDLAANWMTLGGSWRISGGRLAQADITGDDVLIAKPTAGFTDSYVVARLRQIAPAATDGGNGSGALEIGLRVAGPSPPNMYRCDWKPTTGDFILQVQDQTTLGSDLDRIVIQQGYDPTGWFTMHLVAQGTALQCWIDELPGKVLSGTDSRLTNGSIALKTYQAAAEFEFIRVYATQ
jgi:hypothetical protein